MLIDLNTTYQLIQEADNNSNIIGTLSASDKSSISNTFIGFRAIGLCISDTFNHPVFPMPRPVIDTSRLDTSEIFFQYQALYSANELSTLPWHFLVELVGDRYVVLNTRPIDLRYPLKSKDILNNLRTSNDDIKKILDNYELQEYIHIGIIGNSNVDVYTQKLYDTIKTFCIVPIKRILKIRIPLNDFILFFNIGKKIIKSKFFQDLG